MINDSRLRRILVIASLTLLTLTALPSAAGAQSAPSGSAFSTGTNALGQLGDSTIAGGRTSPGPVSVADPVQIASGRDHAYALDASGRIWAWGANSYGQVGDGSTAVRRTPVRLSLTGVSLIEAGHYHGIALRSDGTVWTWGYGSLGQLGLGATANRTTPTQVPGLAGIVRVAAGRDMSYAISGSGQVYAWGNNAYGEVGDGTTTRRTSPVLLSGLPAIADISGGRNHALAVTSGGALWAWGDNTYGQLGDGTQTRRTRPVAIPLTGVRHADGGAHHSVAVTSAGAVLTWGRGYRGQLGLGSTSSRTSPTLVTGLPAAVEVGDGRDQTYAITAAGDVWAWGSNAAGQLGDGTTTQRLRPVSLSTSGVTAVQGGSSHAVLFAPESPSAGSPPSASFSFTCSGLNCSFDGRSSTDPDGDITSYRWEFGDGSQATGATASRTYGSSGTYTARLTVVDSRDATASTTRSVTVTSVPPPSSGITFVGATTASVNSTRATAAVPVGSATGDTMLLLATANRSDITLGAAIGWTPVSAVVDESMQTRIWVAQRSQSGPAPTVQSSATSKIDLQVLSYRGVDPVQPIHAAALVGEAANRAAHTTPQVTGLTGGTLVSYWADKTSATTGWALPSGVIRRAESIGPGSGRITSVSADSTSAGSTVGGLTATATSANSKATMATVVLRPSPGG